MLQMGLKPEGFMCPVICFMGRILTLWCKDAIKGDKAQDFVKIRTDRFVCECEISSLYHCFYLLSRMICSLDWSLSNLRLFYLAKDISSRFFFFFNLVVKSLNQIQFCVIDSIFQPLCNLSFVFLNSICIVEAVISFAALQYMSELNLS